jgi:hypothetical protein
MTRLLRNIATGAYTAYPRPDDAPVLGLDRDTYQVVGLITEPAPDYDPSTHRLEQSETLAWLPDAPDPTGLDGTLTRGWELIELPPPPPPEPPSDWLGFAGWLYLYPPIMAGMAAARQSTDPQGEPATTGLPAAMDEARLRQNYVAFALSWGQFLAASQLPAEAIAEIVGKAQACNLPAEFIAALAPTRQRARNADGAFMGDDPATPDVAAAIAAVARAHALPADVIAVLEGSE